MKAIARIAAGILTLTVAAGCGDGSKEADGVIARQRAYPRQELCDTVYKDCGLPAGFMVNTGAEAKDVTPSGEQSTPAQWIDISYPTYRATIHCTFMPVDDATRDAATANRMERMMLNIGKIVADIHCKLFPETPATHTNRGLYSQPHSTGTAPGVLVPKAGLPKS